MTGTFDDKGHLILRDGTLIVVTGRKGSGKSEYLKLLFRSYPYDKLVIDVAGDDGPSGDGVFELQGDVTTLPKKWPEGLRENGTGRWEPMTLRYEPDAGSATYREDMDAILGLVRTHGMQMFHAGHHGCGLLVHEMAEMAPAGQTQPHMRRLLQHGRHAHVDALFAGPRPKAIEPLIIQQADVVVIYDTNSQMDIKRIAECIDWPEADLAAAVNSLREHEYLLFDANLPPPEPGEPDLRLKHFPALPLDVIHAGRQAKPHSAEADPR